MVTRIPRIVIAGTGSGVGKTSVAIGLARALSRRGLKAQTFKTGPDFLDPTYLALASGRPCYNLDGWMIGKEYSRRLFERKCADADIAIIEGVMGLFDGASPIALDGSTAEIAIWLDAPVLLVVNAHGAARTIAAVVKGCAEFEPGLKVCGVVANNSGGESHRRWLEEALAAAGAPPLVGAIPCGALEKLAGRHLGLVTADSVNLPEEALDKLADEIEKHLAMGKIIELANEATDNEATNNKAIDAKAPLPFFSSDLKFKGLRIGIAKDEAFHFYYRDCLDALECAGAELVEFSPLRDKKPPENIKVLYFGGGYPEEFAERLSSNSGMLDSVREFAQSGGVIYAECGGLMYLSEGIEVHEKIYPMAGIIPAGTRMLEKRKSLGYVEVTLTGDSIWGARGDKLKGHEFHYSELTREPGEADGWRNVYESKKPNGSEVHCAGFQKGNLLASYAHLYFASSPRAVEWFLG